MLKSKEQLAICVCGHSYAFHKTKFDVEVCDFCGCGKFVLINACSKCEYLYSFVDCYHDSKDEPDDSGWCAFGQEIRINLGDDFLCYGTPKHCPKISKKE